MADVRTSDVDVKFAPVAVGPRIFAINFAKNQKYENGGVVEIYSSRSVLWR
jgi:hypothetical protein